MEPKDILTLIISVLALIISGFVAIFTIIKSRNDRTLLLRSMLTSALKEMSTLELETLKLPSNLINTDEFTYLYNRISYSALDQAMVLADQIDSLVTSGEYEIIGLANRKREHLSLAEKYYLKAIGKPSNTIRKSFMHMNYALVLFILSRYDEGKEQYDQAFSLLKDNDDETHRARGFIYEAQAFNERLYNLPSNEELLKNARRIWPSE